MSKVKIILIISLLLVITLPSVSAQQTIEELKSNLEKIRTEFGKVFGDFPDSEIAKLVLCGEPLSKTCNGEQRTELLNEILIYLQFRNHGESCDPGLNAAIENPPPFGRLTADYIAWQKSLLNSKQTFCNPFNHLTCGTSSKKCECIDPELSWKADGIQIGPTPGTCILGLGADCSQLRDYVGRYNKYRNIFTARPINPNFQPPSCGSGTPGSKCSGLDYFPQLVCTMTTGDVLEDLAKYFHDARTLNIGEKCNFDEQNRLFTFTTQERAEVSVRVKNLNAIKSSGGKFCKLQDYQACYASNKCECITPTAYDPTVKECRHPNPDADCINFFNRIQSKINTGFEFNVPGIQEVVQPKLRKIPETCLPAMKTCYAPGFPGAQCECKDLNFTGPTCQTKWTSLLRRQSRLIPYPSDLSIYEEKTKLIEELNRKAIEFEKVFIAPAGSDCSVTAAKEARNVIDLLAELVENFKPLPRDDYDSLIKLFPEVTKKLASQKVCQLQLTCDAQSQKCVQPLLSPIDRSGSPAMARTKILTQLIVIFLIMVI